MKMAEIFISYRRDEDKHAAGRLYSEIADSVPREQIFMDVDAIPPGADFVEVLEGKVAARNVLLAVIGPGWLEARDEHGNRRLDYPDDFVRIEIGAALSSNIPVVPVLLDGTNMPRADSLPDNLKSLARRQAVPVSHDRFGADVDRLLNRLGLVAEAVPSAASSSTESSSAILPGSIPVEVGVPLQRENRYFVPGSGKTVWFKDFEAGPEMVVVRPGSFMMGSPESEEGRIDREGPQHEVRIGAPFAIGRFAVTVAEYTAFVEATEHDRPDSRRFVQMSNHPVVDVSWDDVQAYVKWLSKHTGQPYRLLSEAEWEYAARAGTTTPFWWGSTISTSQANYNGSLTYVDGREGEYREATVSVDSFEPNPWGFYNVHGNVWEWVEDCWQESYEGAPEDGSAWLRDGNGNCSKRVLRGGSWNNNPRKMRAAHRIKGNRDIRNDSFGFRLTRTLSA